MAGGQRGDALEEGAGRARAEEGEEVVDALDVGPGLHHARGEQGLDLGAPEQPAVGLGVVERADAHAISSQDEGAAGPIPERDGELAAGLGEHAFAQVLVEVNPRLGVAAGGEPVAPRQELLAQLGILEQLAVEGDPDRSVLVGDRLPAPRQVDDRQPPGPQRQAGLDVNLLVIRAAMSDRRGHRQEPLSRKFPGARQIDRACDAAHAQSSKTIGRLRAVNPRRGSRPGRRVRGGLVGKSARRRAACR